LRLDPGVDGVPWACLVLLAATVIWDPLARWACTAKKETVAPWATWEEEAGVGSRETRGLPVPRGPQAKRGRWAVLACLGGLVSWDIVACKAVMEITVFVGSVGLQLWGSSVRRARGVILGLPVSPAFLVKLGQQDLKATKGCLGHEGRRVQVEPLEFKALLEGWAGLGV